MVRRIILVFLMIYLTKIDKLHLVLLVTFSQVIHTALIIWMRPYELVKDNINEVMINIVFSSVVITLIFFLTKESCNEISTSMVFYVLNFPGAFIFLSSIGRCYY